MLTNGSGVGQASEIIGARRALRFLVLEGILDGDAEFGAGRQKHAEVFFGEAVLFAAVERQHSRNALSATKRDAQCRLQSRYARGFPEMGSFCGGAAARYGASLLRPPAGKTMSPLKLDGGEKVAVPTSERCPNP